MPRIDHIVFTTPDLARGTAAMTERLGAAPVGGGHHKDMGTHNALWSLSGAYLEVIAIDPEARPPDTPRWFALDAPRPSSDLCLTTWVLAVESLDTAMSRAPAPYGSIRDLSRDHLRWRLTVPDNGIPAQAGALPALIEWPKGTQPPGDTLPDQGMALQSLNLPDRPAIRTPLTALDAAKLVTWRATGPLSATIRRGDGQAVTFDQHTA